MFDKNNCASTKDESSYTSAELIIKLPNGEMLPLSKLPVTKEKGVRGYSKSTPSTDEEGVSSQSASRCKRTSTYTSNTSNSSGENPKEILKNILENKPKSSNTCTDSNKSSTPIISLVQV